MSLYDGTDLSFRTTLGFNKSQREHINTINVNHPENEGRIGAIRNLLNKSGLLSKCNVVEDFLPIDKEDITQSHDSTYVSSILNEQSTSDQDTLNALCSKFDSVFMSPGSVSAAKEAAACCRFVSELIMEEKVPNGMCIVRPPGHHADRSEACGFSIFNNTAQAAEAAFNYGADRILIVDLDVHHGQGTQRIFYDDKRVLYFSIHRYENGNYWPHLRESNFDYIGDGEGRGYNINVPLNETGCGDADYLTAFWHVLWPVALAFNPNFVIVSAGFDSCSGDPLGGMNLTPSCYSHIVYQLKALAQGKLLMVLEGGYNHDVSAIAAAQCIRVLTGECPLPIETLIQPRESTVTSCLNVIAMLRSCWSCFDLYNMRGGTRSSAWENFSPEVIFNPQPIVERENTGDIHQDELVKLEYTVSQEASPSTMIIYDTTSDMHHDTADVNHPEKPQRTQRILSALKASGIFDRCLCVENTRVATNKELEAAHERQYVQRMHRTEKMTSKELQLEADRLNSIFLTNETFAVASRAAGAVLECVDRVNEAPLGSLNAFAVVRPPGHHAGLEKPSGFCIFNNVAVAAHYAMSKHGYKRILILDWDVHHGNGTQEIFYDDDRVLYMSLHRHEGGYFYPLGEPKDVQDVGVGAGLGFNVNVPWNYAKMGDEEYRQAFAKIIMPIAYEFNPDLVFISAGFDAAKGDPLGEYKVLPSTFALMTHQLSGLAGGRCIAVLEGGYNLDSISAAAVSVCETLQSRSCKVVLREEIEEFATEMPKLHPDAWISLRKAAVVQEKHWLMLKGLQVSGEHNHECETYIPSSSSSESESNEVESLLGPLETEENATINKMADKENRPPNSSASSSSGSGGRRGSGSNDPPGPSGASSNMPAPADTPNFLFAIVPLTTCPHLDQVQAVPAGGIDSKAVCALCPTQTECWICLTCYEAYCGRYQNEHAEMHAGQSTHPMALSMADLSVWCYACNDYVHNEVLIPAKSAAHLHKFGEHMPV